MANTATQTPSQKAAASARAAQKADNAKGTSKPKSSGAAKPPKGGRAAADATKATRGGKKTAGPKGSRQNPNRPEKLVLKGEAVVEFSGSDLTDYLAEFVKAEGTSDHDAPIVAKPFVQKGRLYLKSDPLRGFIDSQHGTALTPKQAQTALAELKFERNPFPVRIDGKQTGASHYSAAVSGLPKPIKDALPSEREPAQRKSDSSNGNGEDES